jgi:hypothetical protein
MKAFFADDIGRPLVIVGNGPSAAIPRHDLLPDNPVIFRMNWFFLEDHYYYGNIVDAFFFSISNKMLEQRLSEVIDCGDYDVRSIFSPMKPPSGSDNESYKSALTYSTITQFDHWSLIAQNPTLSRFMMSRPLPTQGMQVLAAALELGFRDITLCGLDMYSSHTARYGYTVPDAVAAALKPKDLSPGYEDHHSLDRDLNALDACLLQYPDATVKHIGPSEHLQARLQTPPERSSLCTFAGRPARELVAAPKHSFVPSPADPTDVELQPGSELPHAVIDGRRCGYVTLVSGPFHHGARALARSLAAVSDIPLLVMCTPSADRAKLASSGLSCVDVPEIINPNTLDTSTKRFAATYSKLNAFHMTHLDRAVYLDSDMIVLQSVDDLFDHDGFAAVADHGLEANYGRFNSGMFAFDPDAALFERLMKAVESTHSYDSGDQGFLNEMFSTWKRLPHEYNVNKRWSAHHPNLFHLDATRVLHFVGIKPWQPEADSSYDALYRLWFSFLSNSELIELIESLRSTTAAVAAKPARKRDSRRAALADRLIRPSARMPRDRATGTLLERVRSCHNDGAYKEAALMLNEEWPGDEAASPDLLRERGKSLMWSGSIDESLTTLRRAVAKYPDHSTLGLTLEKAERLEQLRQGTFGLAPQRALGAGARLAARISAS